MLLKLDKSVAGWRPQVDAAVQGLQHDMEELKLHVLKLEKQSEEGGNSSNTSQASRMAEEGSHQTPLLPMPSTLPLFSGTAASDLGPDGHRVTNFHRGKASGVVHTLGPPPVKGTYQIPTKFSVPHGVEFGANSSRGNRDLHGEQGFNHRLPKLDFPQFDGSDPQSWRMRCEHYFGVYGTHPNLWVRIATIYFMGRAASWLRSSRAHEVFVDWGRFYEAVNRKFDRNQHRQLIRQLDQIKQTGSVSEFYERFDDLMNQLLTYDPMYNTLNLVHRFIEGLRFDIREAVLLHCPEDLESALVLALLQEELSERNQEQRKFVDGSQKFKNAYPLPLPPTKVLKTEEKKGGELNRGTNLSDKVSALRSFRRAQGLCYLCAEKWSPTHKCSGTVQLHAVQELFALFPDNANEDQASISSEDSDSSLLAMSVHAVQGTDSQSTIRLQGKIQGLNILMLVDSGSSASFISDQLADRLTGVQFLAHPLSVKVANGQVLHCQKEMPSAEWFVSGQKFLTTFKVVALGGYDAILGMDWLTKYSPMQIDWQLKSIHLTVMGHEVLLRGVQSDTSDCALISSQHLQHLHSIDSVAGLVHLCASLSDSTDQLSSVPDAVQSLVHEFSHLFEEPSGLPPARDYDHTIPLIPGAVPVNVRPYRYTPAQKDEIEKQVKDMLQKGIIQPSASPFSSPVLLVKKKDGTWRFCVDYRHLNAITVKNKYPLPIIDELMDELAGACWFSKLDLRSGYHQIRMAVGEEAKTAFKTHNGHFEFKVLPFGLTSAPATFQGVMNTVLADQLRQNVLVFVDDILVYSRTLEEHKNHLRQVFETLSKHQLRVKLSKCSFAQTQLSYLGHIISADGVSTDPEKIQVVRQWPVPVSVKDVRSFLGLAGYYRKFVRHFGIISKPLTKLLRKGQPFIWTQHHQEAFDTLKQSLISAPVLVMPDFQKMFVVETDASDRGIGAVLMQDQQSVAFLSKALGHRTQVLSTYEKESLAIILAVDHWRPYLQHDEFLIRSLAFLDNQLLTTSWQYKAMTKLLGLRYRIVYKKGLENGAADALSHRSSDGLPILSALSVGLPDWLQDVVSGYKSDPEALQLLHSFKEGTCHSAHFELQNGILYFKKRVWVGNNRQLQQQVLANLHTAALGGHSGIQVTYQRVKQLS